MKQVSCTIPTPSLVKRERLGVSFYTDDRLFHAVGVRVAFTCATGGVSEGAYAGLNLGSHVGDSPDAVAANRRLALQAVCAGASGQGCLRTGVAGEGCLGARSGLGAAAGRDMRLAVLDQVHGDDVVVIESASDGRLSAPVSRSAPVGSGAYGVSGAGDAPAAGLPSSSCECAGSGGFLPNPVASADAMVVLPQARGVAGMLMYADCTPVVLVSPTGTFSVVHAGWRGAVARIAAKALVALLEADVDAGVDASQVNAYIGPRIGRECFEVGDDVRRRFADEFGEGALFGQRNVDLAASVRLALSGAGMRDERIAELGRCTVCSNGEFFSYRASGGTCGRHGAIALLA